MDPVPQGEQVEKFEVTEREKYLLKIVAAMIAEKPCLKILYSGADDKDAKIEAFEILCEVIEELTVVSPS